MRSFPHHRQIGRLLGRAFTASAKLDPEGCARRGVPAFSSEGRAHFAQPEPPLGVAAHEATHVLQQHGATRDMGLGAEGQAAAVERRVVAGQNANQLLGSHGAAVGTGVRHYTEIAKDAQGPGKWDAKMDLRLADDGNMAVGERHDFWATPAKVSQSNKVLAAAKSVIVLELQKETISGLAPDDKKKRQLSKVLPINLRTKSGEGFAKTSGDSMKIWADCGRTAADIMGTGKGTGEGIYNNKLTAVYRGPGEEEKSEPGKQTKASQPEPMYREILCEKLGVEIPLIAAYRYDRLPVEEREKIDREAGINRYAAPKTGQSYAISTAPSDTSGDWNYHWGAVIMTSGADRTTLEGFSVNVPDEQNNNWWFQMYGPTEKAGQTFHEQQVATGHHGTTPVTMSVKVREDSSAKD